MGGAPRTMDLHHLKKLRTFYENVVMCYEMGGGPA
jgi:hypothetical protein